MRCLEIHIPDMRWQEMQNLVDEENFIDCWFDEQDNGLLYLHLLTSKGASGGIMDRMEERFGTRSGFRIVVYPVEATIPRPDMVEDKTPIVPVSKRRAAEEKRSAQIGREEIYADVVQSTQLTKNYIWMVILSSIVAGIGIYRDNTAIVIGAMVIAPLLGPNVGLALAATLGDFGLARRALKATIGGVLFAALIGIIWGMIHPLDPTAPGIALRTQVGIGDIALALTSGCAGVLAFTTGASASLVGVMVAVALLPPLMTCGLLFGSMQLEAASGAFLVLICNVICINLAGVLTFLSQGIHPLGWNESRRAKYWAWFTISVWIVLLLTILRIILGPVMFAVPLHSLQKLKLLILGYF